MTVGKYVSENYNNITNENVTFLTKRKYVNPKYLIRKNNKKIRKKDNFIINDKYIPKSHHKIQDANYLNIIKPKKIKDKKIKLVEIQPLYDGQYYKINYVYESGNKKSNKKKDVILPNNHLDCISIDLGMKNLMTIYDPTGKQCIVKGKYISKLNYHFNEINDKLKSETKKKNNKMTSKRIQRNLIRRKNKIKHYFLMISKWIRERYKHKKYVIIGYNKFWKQKPRMGKKMNRDFINIPYRQLINILEYQLKERGINVILKEESYTSKCDALGLEEICKHENYSGKRIKRGLFLSSVGKVINADLNGAINIMRKLLKFEITGESILNPVTINIFRDV